jgi:acetyl esterase/lipase
MKTKLSIYVLALGALLALFVIGFAGTARGAEGLVPFTGEKSSWHGFDRYDFLMDEQTMDVKPASAKAKGAKGQRPCIVVVPKTVAAGNPWSWQACYWDHEPQTEVELLKRGFHIAFVAPDGGVEARDKVWDAWYKFLTEKHGLAKKAAFVGMSKGGVNEYSWGAVNPEKVACIYADNPALWDEDFAKLPALAKHDVPLLHVCGSEDFLVDRYTRVVEDMYHTLGGQITVIIKDGHAHHRHSLQNAKPIADWIEQHMTPSTANKPAFVDATYTKAYYYSLEPRFIYLKEENSYATARGPGYTECYDRYDSPTSGKFKTGGFSIVVPKKVAPGKPWVFTGDALERDATVEQALLAKGYHILIISPLGSGFTQKQWNDAYKLLVDNGFSNKPVLKGIGPKAGEAYAWAVANPDKVSCIYARNPLMKSLMASAAKQQQPIDNLAALAKAGVPVLHDSGALDPWLENHTRVVEKRYQELGGKIQVIVREGEGHFPLSPKDPKSVVDFIVKNASTGAAQPKQGRAPDGVELLRDVVVGTGGGRAMHADIARPKTPPAGLMPAVIWIHGGGWTSGSHHEFQQTIQLAKHGYLVLSVEYRFADEARWPAQIEDCKLAVRWLRANAAKYQVNPDRIGCWGTSAGGHLAALMGVTSDRPELEGKGGSEGFSSTVQAVVNFCGPTRFTGNNYIVPSRKMAGGTYEEKTDVYRQMSPLDNVNPKAPPFLFVNGEKDTTVPVFHAELMTEALKKVNVPVEMIVVKNAGHGYVFNGPRGGPPAEPSPAEVDAAVLKFLDANLKKNASTGAAQPKSTAIPVNGDAPTGLYGAGAASRDDGVKKQAGDSFRWTGSGQITWKVQIDRAGDYEVALNHAAEPGAVGQDVQVSSSDSTVRYTLTKTKGVFGNKSYEMTPIKGRLRLEAGTQTITLSIPDAPKAMAVLQFRSLELIPVAANAAIEAERQEARRARASTEWLAQAGYGLMFHWTSQSIGKDGTHKPYTQAVDDIDVKRFADMVEETGAGYVIFTIGHAKSDCPAPLKAWEKYHPGKTTRRDLIAEMADALSAKGIKLMCYLNAASLTKYPKASEEEFSRIMTEVVTEFGEHYKEKVAGYWFDCCYQAKEKYPGFSFREFFKTCKAGNPNRIVALNSWIYPNVSEWQEYWAGETASPVGLPLKGTTQEHGPGAGLRYHALLIMEPYWVQQKVEMPRPQFTAQQLGDYIDQCKANGGAVTINLGIYQDGTVDPNAVDVLKEVRKRVR